MKTETYLNACVKLNRKEWTQRSYRQYQAFRARILRMDAEKDAEIDGLFKFYLQAINLYPNLENLREAKDD